MKTNKKESIGGFKNLLALKVLTFEYLASDPLVLGMMEERTVNPCLSLALHDGCLPVS